MNPALRPLLRRGPASAIPRSVRAAQWGLWLQVVYFIGVGVVPAFMGAPAFGVAWVAVTTLGPLNEAPFSTAASMLTVVIFSTTGLVRGFGAGNPFARVGAIIAIATLALLVAATARYSWSPAFTITTAIPWFALQAMTVIGLCTPAANRWFLSREASAEPR